MNLAEATARLASLGFPAGDYAVHASGVLLAHGLIDNANDLDLIARGPAWQAACQLAPPEQHTTDRVVRLGDVEVFDGWLGDGLDELLATAETVHGLPCVRLEHVLAFKERLNRPKDARHIELIRAHLGLPPRPLRAAS